MKKYINTALFIILLMTLTPALSAQENFEFGFHYSRWSINIIRGYIEEGLSEGLESTFRDDFLSELQAVHPDLSETSYNQEIEFDSSGDNFGFEVRWYPGGRTGSFSVGLSVEKTTMTISIPTLTADLELSDGTVFTADADAQYFINPLSFHLNCRWDILPTSRIHPYLTLGFGAATGAALDNSELSYAYSGERLTGIGSETYASAATKTLAELRDEMEGGEEEFFLPGFIPFIHLGLGLKAEVTESLHLLFEGGIWNGFILRGGVSFRI